MKNHAYPKILYSLQNLDEKKAFPLKITKPHFSI
jgi:hypothetical protein